MRPRALTMPYTIEIVDDLMCVMDQDGNGCDCHVLQSREGAERQLRDWRDQQYTFDYAEALRDVSEFFSNL